MHDDSLCPRFASEMLDRVALAPYDAGRSRFDLRELVGAHDPSVRLLLLDRSCYDMSSRWCPDSATAVYIVDLLAGVDVGDL